MIERYRLPGYAVGVGSKGCVTFSPTPIVDYETFKANQDVPVTELAWLWNMNRGIFMTPGREEEWTLSVTHTDEAIDDYVRRLRRDGGGAHGLSGRRRGAALTAQPLASPTSRRRRRPRRLSVRSVLARAAIDHLGGPPVAGHHVVPHRGEVREPRLEHEHARAGRPQRSDLDGELRGRAATPGRDDPIAQTAAGEPGARGHRVQADHRVEAGIGEQVEVRVRVDAAVDVPAPAIRTGS